METVKCLVLFLLVILVRVSEIACKCSLSLADDFGSPSPVYLRDGGLLAPTAPNVAVNHGATLTVACPGDKRSVVVGGEVTGQQIVRAFCVANQTFRVDGWQGHFKDLKCNGPPWFTSEEDRPCHGGKIYRVGYNIEDHFHSLYEACFDSNQIRTLYVKHQLSPASKYFQGGTRPQFIEGGLFGKVRMSQLYKNENQKSRLNAVLGENMDQEYLSKKQFLTRGHLAPRADFPLAALHRATFHYVNTAPQWMRGNAGDWAALEDAVRRRASALNSTLTIYTGTQDVLALPDKDGELRRLYLRVDDNNNEIVPVPMYLFKLVYDPVRKRATAFVTINSSFFTPKMNDNLQFCDDICDGDRKFSWLKWRADDTHSFCCQYEQFVEKVKILPTLNVEGPFY